MLEQAIEIARNIKRGKCRVVAIVTDRRNRILSIGMNSYTKTHPRQFYYAEKAGNRRKIFLHAEIDALIKCRHKPSKIFVARINSKGDGVMSRPCEVCQLAIKDMGIKEVYHT